MSRALTVLAPLAVVALMACGSKSQPAPEPTKEPAKATEPAKAADPAKPAEKAAEPKPAEKATAPAAEADAGAAPAEPAAEADAGGGLAPLQSADVGPSPALFPLTATPGTIVKDPNPESPEGLIARALAAAMDPDEAKGWAAFEALLAEDQKYGQALEYRRQMNFAAMRRKVKLFLVEDETKPIYQVDRILEESASLIRIFVHNKQSMPTPCEVRLDATNHWKIGICSL